MNSLHSWLHLSSALWALCRIILCWWISPEGPRPGKGFVQMLHTGPCITQVKSPWIYLAILSSMPHMNVLAIRRKGNKMLPLRCWVTGMFGGRGCCSADMGLIFREVSWILIFLQGRFSCPVNRTVRVGKTWFRELLPIDLETTLN